MSDFPVAPLFAFTLKVFELWVRGVRAFPVSFDMLRCKNCMQMIYQNYVSIKKVFTVVHFLSIFAGRQVELLMWSREPCTSIGAPLHHTVNSNEKRTSKQEKKDISISGKVTVSNVFLFATLGYTTWIIHCLHFINQTLNGIFVLFIQKAGSVPMRWVNLFRSARYERLGFTQLVRVAGRVQVFKLPQPTIVVSEVTGLPTMNMEHR